MTTHLCIAVQFLQPSSHGCGERGNLDWPPSPLRLFQALVAAAAARWNERLAIEHAAPALRWLESLPPPTIIAPLVLGVSSKYRLYVPDNVADKLNNGWSRGIEANIAVKRTEKDVRAIILPDDQTTVSYLWELPDTGLDDRWNILRDAARSITHLGWGVDMVAGDASLLTKEEGQKLQGERWSPTERGADARLRVPIKGTLEALATKHTAFLNRLGPENEFRPVPPLTTFRFVGYSRPTAPPRRPYEAFRLLNIVTDKFRPFDPAKGGKEIAGMLRHAVATPEMARAIGWSEETVARYVLGHGEPLGAAPSPVVGPRLAFIPVPTIRPGGRENDHVVGSINRVLITVFGMNQDDDLWLLKNLLDGEALIREQGGAQVARLDWIDSNDNVLDRYYNSSSTTWATVTPVILPGFDDPRGLRRRLGRSSSASVEGSTQSILEKLNKRIDDLLRKAIRQAGYPELLAQNAEIEWRSVGFWPGTEHANRYDPPNHLERFRRLHVRLTWRDAQRQPVSIPGPICLGGGRFCGFGLFAAAAHMS